MESEEQNWQDSICRAVHFATHLVYFTLFNMVFGLMSKT